MRAALVKFGLTALLLYLLLQRTDLPAIVRALEGVGPGLLATLAALNFSGVLLAAYKWRMLLPQARFSGLLSACLVSYYVALLLPGQIAQEAAKAYFLRTPSLPPMSSIAASVVVDKIVSVIGLLIVGTVGIMLSKRELPAALVWVFALAALAGLLLLFWLRLEWPYAFVRGQLAKLESASARWKKAGLALSEVLDAWHSYASDLDLIARNVVAAIAYQLLGALAFYLLSIGINLSIDFVDWCWITGALTIALFLPLTVGGLGIREGTLIGVLGALGCSKEDALAVSLVAFGFVVMLAAIGAMRLYTLRAPLTQRP